MAEANRVENFEVEHEVGRLGRDHGRALAAALLLASEQDGVGGSVKQRMAQIVVDQIETMVAKLHSASFPDDLARLYERNARQGVRDAIMETARKVTPQTAA